MPSSPPAWRSAASNVSTQTTGKAKAPVDDPAKEPVSEEDATHPERAPAFMASAVLAFNEQLERIVEVAMVLILGAMLAGVSWAVQPLAWLIPVMFLGIRPVATFLSLLPNPDLSRAARDHRLVRRPRCRIALLPGLRADPWARGR